MTMNRILRAAAAVAAALTLSACSTAMEEEIGQCEPGVEDISQIASAIPETSC